MKKCFQSEHEQNLSTAGAASNAVRNGLSRRSVLAGGLAAAGGLGSLSLWSVASVAAEPRRGGTLKIGVHSGSTTDTLAPNVVGSDNLFISRFCVFNNLVEIDSSNTPIPELAESWEANQAATEWIFNIRKDVTFHNGKTLTADDVIYSISLHMSPNTTPASGFMNVISEVRKENSHQIRLILKEGVGDIPFYLGTLYLGIVPDGFQDWAHPMGTGGYSLVEWNPGAIARFRRNPDYWKAGRAWVDEVQIFTIADAAARLAALQSGQIHVMNRLPARLATRVEAIPTMQVVRFRGGSFATLAMSCNGPPFADNNVRLAVKYGIDREQMSQLLMQGYALVGNDHPIASSSLYCNTELEQRSFDPEKARWYLAKAGENSLTVDLYASEASFDEAVDAATLMGQSLSRAGMQVKVTKWPADGFFTEVFRKKPFYIDWWATRPTPDLIFSLAFKSDAPWNEAYWSNPTFDKLLREAKSLTDFDKRREIYWQMQEIMWNDGGSAVFLFPDALDAYARNVKGLQQDKFRAMMGCRVAERVWLQD